MAPIFQLKRERFMLVLSFVSSGLTHRQASNARGEDGKAARPEIRDAGGAGGVGSNLRVQAAEVASYNAMMSGGLAAPDPRAADEFADPSQITRLLNAAAAGDSQAPGALFKLVYDQLREIAQKRMAGERRGHTLQATALVNEACLRLLGSEKPPWSGRAAFFHAAAQAMRQILIDHARARNADKRGGGRLALSISNVADLAADFDPAGFLALEDAILRLESVDSMAASVVRLRFYAGLEPAEVAEALGASERTVRREWAFARGWLRDALEREPE